MDNRAGEMMVFVRVVDAGSFSAAARAMRLSTSTVSKSIARLEARLSVRLVERSTRRLRLTRDGEFYYERSKALLSQLDETEQELARGGRHAEGVVRVNASVSFGTHVLEPLLPAFLKTYPKLTLDLSLSDEVVDLYLDRTDIAFRVGRLQATSLVARKVGVARRVIVGSPAYFARRGKPKKPEDLARHNCLGFNFRRAATVWPHTEPGSLIANNGETVGRMALAGVGLARLGDYHVREALARGELVEVLRDSAISDTEDIHAVYVGGKTMPQRVRAFLDDLVPRMQKVLGLSDRPGAGRKD